jgi:hypothetical protein
VIPDRRGRGAIYLRVRKCNGEGRVCAIGGRRFVDAWVELEARDVERRDEIADRPAVVSYAMRLNAERPHRAVRA